MTLAVDVGNSNIVLAIHDGQQWTQEFRNETKSDQPVLYFESALRNILLEWAIHPTSINQIVISCVVPDVLNTIVESVSNVIQKQPLILGPDIFSQLDMEVPHIYEIGSDLVSNAYAAFTRYKLPSIVVDFGTALTYTVIDHKGIKGVSIAPGLYTAINSLTNNTALLPLVEVALPVSKLGHNTTTAIQSGVLHGYVGMVSYMVEGIEKEFGQPLVKIATGGLSHVLTPLIDVFHHIDRHLTLDGMRLIHNFIVKQS